MGRPKNGFLRQPSSRSKTFTTSLSQPQGCLESPQLALQPLWINGKCKKQPKLYRSFMRHRDHRDQRQPFSLAQDGESKQHKQQQRAAASSGDQTDTFILAENPAMTGSGGGVSASSLVLFMSRVLFPVCVRCGCLCFVVRVCPCVLCFFFLFVR